MKEPTPGKRASLGLKVTPDIKTRLDAAARQSGRTQSQEAELRLERSFKHQALLHEVLTLAYGEFLGRLLIVIGDVMQSAGRVAALYSTFRLLAEQNWMHEPNGYAQAERAAARILEKLRPESDMVPPPRSKEFIGNLEMLGCTPEHREWVLQNAGTATADALLEAIAGDSSIDESDEAVKAMRWLLAVRKLLAALKDES